MTQGISTTIYSAYKLDAGEINQIIEKFPFIKSESINNVVDESILAGIRIHYGTKIIDLTLKTKLVNLKNKLYESSR